MPYPQWVKNRKTEILPPLTTGNVPTNEEEYYVHPWVRSFSTTLYPSDWARYKLQQVAHAVAPEREFWEKALSNAAQKDPIHQKSQQTIYDIYNQEFGEEKSKILKQALERGKDMSKDAFEELFKKYKESDAATARKIEQETAEAIMQLTESMGRKSAAPLVKLLEEKEQLLKEQLKCDWKLESLLKEFIPETLKFHVNVELFKEFGIEANFVKEYQQWEEAREKKEDELESMQEVLVSNYVDWGNQFVKSSDEFSDNIDLAIAGIETIGDDMHLNLRYELLEKYPKIKAKIHFLWVRGRLDVERTDEDYRKLLAHDHTWFNLPRNP